MKTRFLLSAVLALTILLAACAPKAAAVTKQATVPTEIPPIVKPTTTAPPKPAVPTPTVKPAAAPTKEAASNPTPGPALINDIIVEDQAVTSGTVLINMVDSMQPGWVAIFTDQNDKPGTLLGYVAVPTGTSDDVKVTVDAAKASNKMIAMLLVDAGTIGAFEYPGPDEPVKNANITSDVMAVFSRVKTTSQ